MLERTIRRALKAQIDLVFASAESLKAFLRLQGHAVEADDDDIISVMVAQPPVVYQDLARVKETFPNIAIVLGPEAEVDKQFLDDFAQYADAELAAELEAPAALDAPIYVSHLQRNFDLYVHAVNADVCIILFEVLKSLVLLMRPALSADGVLRTQVSGRGLEPVPVGEAGGDFIFRRVLRLGALELFQATPLADGEGSFSAIGGLHVAGGSTSSVGDAKTLVTTSSTP